MRMDVPLLGAGVSEMPKFGNITPNYLCLQKVKVVDFSSQYVSLFDFSTNFFT